jgi:hypothetical protein
MSGRMAAIMVARPAALARLAMISLQAGSACNEMVRF